MDAELASDVEPADGRAARSHRTRRAIVDAMRALHAEGNLRPTAPRVAERAGVSLRTVWQQFADMETLLVEATRRDHEILRSLVRRIDPDQPLADRIAQFVRQRARVLEQMTPSWQAARLHGRSEELHRNTGRVIAAARAELEAVFARELSQLDGPRRQHLGDALHAIASGRSGSLCAPSWRSARSRRPVWSRRHLPRCWPRPDSGPPSDLSGH